MLMCRQVDETGKRVSKPQEQIWLERATLVKDDEGHWLVRDVHELQPAGSSSSSSSGGGAAEAAAAAT